ncbi:molybdopterin molybdotransferase MoeA [Flavobacteriaceae bacterium F89]|uniref:Molybdopterin molybdenumtransferase n=1 Tax=Cerina litoralis TaxID=2874477 RepID=A0AAE3JRW2_9FLAO|nr:gephyrin-like molybdotransferase Glp [Cerina litoralis]MCG2460037.1 molybdopterin molybdotransferase MoeA [Cerina litoralis]
MIPVIEAVKIIDKQVAPLEESEQKSVLDSRGQILFEDVFAPINMPPFRQSAMDGYALSLHDDTFYKVIDEVQAGDGHHPILKTGEAVRIFTGAPVPDTANAVIMQEKVTVANNKIILRQTVSTGENIRPMGEQVKKDNIALTKGTKITAAAVGYLTSLGITKINVYKKPSIGVIVTGNELVAAGSPLTYGRIFESNSEMLLSALRGLGYTDVTVQLVRDDYAETFSVLEKAIDQHDLVLITGGISVGDYDYVGKALQEIPVEQLFYKVNQKPGKPLFFGKKKNTNVFALPGNPAAVLSCFYIYVYPALQRLSGDIGYKIPRIKAKSKSDFTKKGNRAQFLKAELKDGEVTILEGQSSAMLQTFALANAMVYIPEEKDEVLIGELVEVILMPI